MARIGCQPSRLSLSCCVLPRAGAAGCGVIVRNDMVGPVQGTELPPEDILDAAGFAVAWDEITQWPDYHATPLHSLPGLARTVGVEKIWFKDESKRFRLKSFKALGGAYAVLRLAIKEITRAT